MTRAMTPLPWDEEDMLGAVHGLPDQLADAWARYRDLRLPPEFSTPRSVVIAGMGGSAIGGDIAAAGLADALPAPVVVVRDYRLPSWVGPDSLFIASSFSGNTEETLAAWAEAGRRGADRVALTTGGALAERARASEAPVVRLIPGGAPRAAFGQSLAGVLAVLSAAGLAGGIGGRLALATTAMRALATADALEDPEAEAATETNAHHRSESDNRADTGATAVPPLHAPLPTELARWLRDQLVQIITPEALSSVGRRWKAQLNENAKQSAVWDCLPELNHNSVVGYGRPTAIADIARTVFLTGPSTHPRIVRRMGLTAELLDQAAWAHATIAAPEDVAAGGLLAEALWLVQYGDLLSVHLARAHAVDPTPIPSLIALKARLASRA